MSLTEAARTSAHLDQDMERLHRELHGNPDDEPDQLADSLPLSPHVLARLINLQQQVELR